MVDQQRAPTETANRAESISVTTSLIPQHQPIALQSRGELIESTHYGSLIAIDPNGQTEVERGQPEALFYPRSALKPLFAVALLKAGAELSDRQLALAAASHSGAAEHQEIAMGILEEAHLGIDALRNSTDLPYGVREKTEWLAAGNGPTHLAQNCSGKHAAMVSLCVKNGWPVESYLDASHPIPALLRETIQELTGVAISVVSTDGCGTEVYGLPLSGMARAFAKLVAAEPGTAERRVADAMRQHPELVAGEGRDVTSLMRAVPGLLAKDGFEGIQIIALADGSAIAIKVADGGDRARMPAAVPALLALGVEPDLVKEFNELPVLGGGQLVGTLAGIPV